VAAMKEKKRLTTIARISLSPRCQDHNANLVRRAVTAGERRRKVERTGAEKKTECHFKFLRARSRGRRDIRLTLLEVRVTKCKRLGTLAVLALAAAYLVKGWLENR